MTLFSNTIETNLHNLIVLIRLRGSPGAIADFINWAFIPKNDSLSGSTFPPWIWIIPGAHYSVLCTIFYLNLAFRSLLFQFVAQGFDLSPRKTTRPVMASMSLLTSLEVIHWQLSDVEVHNYVTVCVCVPAFLGILLIHSDDTCNQLVLSEYLCPYSRWIWHESD